MKNLKYATLLVVFLLFSGCSRFLDEKSDSALAIPVTLDDNQALLDRYLMLGLNPTSGEVSAGDVYVTDADFNAIAAEQNKRLYTWQPDYVSISSGNDWENCYSKINVFNNVLFNIDHYDIAGADNVKGQALLFRAAAYLDAAQLWCLVYDKNTAQSKMGLPLRLNPDMNIPSVRSTLKETYEQILKDLHEASSLLPVTQMFKTRPSKGTALAYLCRTYLYMGDYENALTYGNQALSLSNELLNYNNLNPSAAFPIPELNVEVLMPSSMGYSPFFTSSKAKIAMPLYNSYESNDLRKSIFFRTNASGEILFKGNYSGSTGRMTCIATDEVYLSVAECYAQLNEVSNAMHWLNQLLINRWKQGTYVNKTASDKEEALQIIRLERRKELTFRSLRWADIKRYNREGASISLSRTVNGQIFNLPANDLRFAIAIPEDIIQMTGMPQNER